MGVRGRGSGGGGREEGDPQVGMDGKKGDQEGVMTVGVGVRARRKEEKFEGGD